MDAANWGKLGYLEAEQTEALEALLKSHGDEVEAIRYSVESPRECALRFLRARKFDIEKTHEIISEALQKFKEVRSHFTSFPSHLLSFELPHVLTFLSPFCSTLSGSCF